MLARPSLIQRDVSKATLKSIEVTQLYLNLFDHPKIIIERESVRSYATIMHEFHIMQTFIIQFLSTSINVLRPNKH